MLDRRGHGDPASRQRSRIWIPLIVLVFVVVLFLVFLAIDQLAHDQEALALFEDMPTHLTLATLGAS